MLFNHLWKQNGPEMRIWRTPVDRPTNGCLLDSHIDIEIFVVFDGYNSG